MKADSNEQLQYWVCLILPIIAFGPYISDFGIRFDHIVVYGLVLIITIYLLVQGINKQALLNSLAIIIYLLMTSAIWMLISTYWNLQGDFPIRATLAGMDNNIQPAAVMYIIWAITQQNTDINIHKRALYFVALATMTMLLLNTLISLVSAKWDIWFLVHRYVPSVPADSVVNTVWEDAHIVGRYTGIFNMPFDAGVAYSLALFLWIYIVAVYQNVNWYLWLLLAGILLGGLLPQSKVFILGGLPLGLIYIYLTKIYKNIFNSISFLSLLIVAITLILLFKMVDLHHLGSIFSYGMNGIDGILSSIFDTRYSSDAKVIQYFTKTIANSPIYGNGYITGQALDNAYLFYLYQGGIVCLIIYIALLSAVFGGTIIGISRSHPEAKLLAFILLLLLSAGLGAPVLTAARVTIPLSIVIGLCLICVTHPRNGHIP